MGTPLYQLFTLNTVSSFKIVVIVLRTVKKIPKQHWNIATFFSGKAVSNRRWIILFSVENDRNYTVSFPFSHTYIAIKTVLKILHVIIYHTKTNRLGIPQIIPVHEYNFGFRWSLIWSTFICTMFNATVTCAKELSTRGFDCRDRFLRVTIL